MAVLATGNGSSMDGEMVGMYREGMENLSAKDEIRLVGKFYICPLILL